LPLVYSSLQEHQGDDVLCQDLKTKVENKIAAAGNFCIHNGLLCYFPKKARRRRWVEPSSLRSILLQYFHNGILAGHLGARKTLGKIVSNFWWPNMRKEVFEYVSKCELCQRAKPAQNVRVGLHSVEPCSEPIERLFVDFVGPLVRSKRGNIAILVVVNAFSKFVCFYPVRRITAQVVLDCLERSFFSAYGSLNVWWRITPGCFAVGCLVTFVFSGEWSTLLLLLIIPRLRLRNGLTVIWNPPWKFSTTLVKKLVTKIYRRLVLPLTPPLMKARELHPVPCS